MATKSKIVEFDKCAITVEFDTVRNLVSVSKDYFKGDLELLHCERLDYNLRTLPLSVALQMASGHVQNCGLVEYSDDE